MVGLGDFAIVRKKDSKRFPGPGSYSAREGFGPGAGSLAWSIGQKIPVKQKTGTGPIGPGEYEVKPVFGQFSNFRRPPSADEANGGAAGSSPRSAESSSKRARGGKKEGEATITNPKQYHMALMPSSPRYSILGKPAAKETEAEDVRGGPGPGAYTLSSTLSHNGVSLLAKAKNFVPDETPGPGGYTVARFGDKLPTPVPPAPPKTAQAKPGVPGPGTYNLGGTIAERCTPKAGRIAFTSTFPGRNFLPDPPTFGPGPGGYPIPPTDFDTFSNTQGKPMNHVKGVTIQTRHVRSGELDAIFPQPGPGEYVVPGTFDGKKGISIAQRIPQPPNKLNVPGPGGYDNHTTIAETIKQKHFPGPRFDGNRAFDKSAAATRGAAAGDDAQVGSMPGPTTYDYHNFDIAGKNKGFTLSGRSEGDSIFVSNIGVPGPGTYNIKESAVTPHSGGGFTFHKGQFNEKPDFGEPGPGAYDQKKINLARSSTFGSARWLAD